MESTLTVIFLGILGGGSELPPYTIPVLYIFTYMKTIKINQM